jgi:hypothetical protein
MNPDLHVPVKLIWEYSLNPAALVPAQLDHLHQCDHCVAILALSQLSKSLQQLQEKLSEHARAAE